VFASQAQVKLTTTEVSDAISFSLDTPGMQAVFNIAVAVDSLVAAAVSSAHVLFTTNSPTTTPTVTPAATGILKLKVWLAFGVNAGGFAFKKEPFYFEAHVKEKITSNFAELFFVQGILSYQQAVFTLGSASAVHFKVETSPPGELYEADGTTAIPTATAGAVEYGAVLPLHPTASSLRLKPGASGSTTITLTPTGGTHCTVPGTVNCKYRSVGYTFTVVVSEQITFLSNFLSSTCLLDQESPEIKVS